MEFFHTSIAGLFIWLLVGHALGDYVLQNDFIAKAKNHTTTIGQELYLAVLPAHAMIHAGFVLLFTGSAVLSLVEFIVHGLTDWLKCDDRLSFYQDQAIHVITKVIIAIAFWMFFV